MARESSDYALAAAAAAFICAAAFVGYWRLSLQQHQPGAVVPGEGYQHIVKENYPLPAQVISDVTAPTETFTSFLSANPFSPLRRQTPASSLGGAETTQPPGSQAGGPIAPKFAYKGRMQLGSQQRAILEDTAAGKTYFLEVGQAVANFKVLDIDEKRVLLSDPQTHEEVAVPLASTASP